VSANPVRDATGNIIGSVSVVRDITGLKNAEEALRDSMATLEAFIDASPGILNIEDEEFRYLKTDRMTPTYFGLNRQTIVGRSVKDLAPDFIRDYGSMMRSVIETGQPVLNVELSNRVPTKPDELTYWRASYFRVPLPGGKRGIGIVGVDITDRKKAEEELKRKNDDLNALNEEVTATQEELQQNVEELSRREEELRKALAEKEVLLSEIHHRVKNNLTAFISLLSLEGSVEDTPVGRDLKIDLQNRARSMALIHETLYRTQQFSEVDMEAYLTPLVEQIVNSYTSPQPIRIIVEAKGVSLDLARATPAGLIVNELVTNSFKHGFPKDAIACRADQKDPCTIGVRLTKKEGTYVLSVWDNGVGMAAGFDPLTAKSLGLKLVNFLAKHQMRAKVEVKTVKGTEFVFRFKARDHGA
jgi:PAS domain S-box-containing protein